MERIWWQYQLSILEALVNGVKARGKGLGIYASRYMWQSIFASFLGSPRVGSKQLWYAHCDDSASFSDYQGFGGWGRPNIKQFQDDVTLCGAGIDKIVTLDKD